MLIPRELFHLAKIASTETSRYALAGVHFERRAGKPYAAVTDGRKLVAATWTESPLAEFPTLPEGFDATENPTLAVTVPIDACKKAVKMGGTKTPTKPILNNVVMAESSVNGKVPLLATDLESTDRLDPVPVKGQYPSWRDIFPQYLGGQRAATARISLRYLREVVNTMESIIGKGENVVVTLAMDADNGSPDPRPLKAGDPIMRPITLTAVRESVTIGAVLMPYRGQPETWNP